MRQERATGGATFFEQLLAPVRTGVILIRDDLVAAARELGLGLRVAERRYVVGALLGHDAAATLRWIAERGGENVYPRELEKFLYAHPEIADVQVVGVPDEHYGEELCAWATLRNGSALAEDDVREFCRGRLAHFKVPRYVVFVDEFPMTVTGEVQKFKIREESIRLLELGAAGAIESA